MLQGFKKFILRGNVIDLAVAVVIGAAFVAVVNALVKDFLTPLIAAAGGKPDFSTLYFTVNGSRFMYGDFINALISFLVVAAAVYFAVVLPLNAVMTRFRGAPEKKTCPECLTEVPFGARRCSACASPFVEQTRLAS